MYPIIFGICFCTDPRDGHERGHECAHPSVSTHHECRRGFMSEIPSAFERVFFLANKIFTIDGSETLFRRSSSEMFYGNFVRSMRSNFIERCRCETLSLSAASFLTSVFLLQFVYCQPIFSFEVRILVLKITLR